MTDPMTPERFALLADAYGGIERWPDHLQAQGWQMEHDPACAAHLAAARALDVRLAQWQAPVPSPDLRRTVAASYRRHWTLRARVWWSALGIGTALAGATAGSALAFALETGAPPAGFEATAFGEMGQVGETGR
ncbi:hypothetical protein [Novosphingobium sp. SG720]|uniref:hypothetical protein n=1 Tax=Novosphingobium sp. SG720 TaxID=2586998 RepID=UPI0014461F76|nr:hypothetical protein [Novosphingobium sp. SG720]NKJ42139.1 hypothetical protein [Novosphingobium sp. SG720]